MNDPRVSDEQGSMIPTEASPSSGFISAAGQFNCLLLLGADGLRICYGTRQLYESKAASRSDRAAGPRLLHAMQL
jgi:hypothetical protein